MGKLRKMARSDQVNGKGVQGVVEVTVLAYGSDEDDLVEADVLSESMVSGDDDDTNSRLSSRNTLGHERNRDPKLKQTREMVRKNTSGSGEPNEAKQKMAESP